MFSYWTAIVYFCIGHVMGGTIINHLAHKGVTDEPVFPSTHSYTTTLVPPSLQMPIYNGLWATRQVLLTIYQYNTLKYNPFSNKIWKLPDDRYHLIKNVVRSNTLVEGQQLPRSAPSQSWPAYSADIDVGSCDN